VKEKNDSNCVINWNLAMVMVDSRQLRLAVKTFFLLTATKVKQNVRSMQVEKSKWDSFATGHE
jgi:hypothetical protein